MAKKKVPTVSSKRGVLHIENVEPALQRAFHAWCALRGITIRDKVISLLRQTIKDSAENKGA